MFLKFAKGCIESCLSKFENKKRDLPFLAGNTVAMVIYCLMKIITCSPMIEPVFDTVIVAPIAKEWL